MKALNFTDTRAHEFDLYEAERLVSQENVNATTRQALSREIQIHLEVITELQNQKTHLESRNDAANLAEVVTELNETRVALADLFKELEAL